VHPERTFDLEISPSLKVIAKVAFTLLSDVIVLQHEYTVAGQNFEYACHDHNMFRHRKLHKCQDISFFQVPTN
jgi:hypothetical protein